MRLTLLTQTARGLPERVGEGEDQYELRPGVLKDLERVKWYLWHGNVFQALKELQGLEMDSTKNGRTPSGLVPGFPPGRAAGPESGLTPRNLPLSTFPRAFRAAPPR